MAKIAHVMYGRVRAVYDTDESHSCYMRIMCPDFDT